MSTDENLRRHVLNLLSGRGARMPFEDAVADFPLERINEQPPNVDYTPWHLIEHLRIAQWDMLEYVRNAAYVAPKWPDDYWPAPGAEATPEMWGHSVKAFQDDLEALAGIVRNPQTDLYAQVPCGAQGHTILRGMFIIADHNAYHIGELGILRQVMGAWPDR